MYSSYYYSRYGVQSVHFIPIGVFWHILPVLFFVIVIITPIEVYVRHKNFCGSATLRYLFGKNLNFCQKNEFHIFCTDLDALSSHIIFLYQICPSKAKSVLQCFVLFPELISYATDDITRNIHQLYMPATDICDAGEFIR